MTGNRATIALIMANYNHAKYLHTSVSGLCDQTRPADEIIIVDDGSTDNSVEILEGYASKHQNIHLLRNERNSGVLYSVKRAIEACQSDYIALLAADDRIFPGFVEKSMSLLEKHPSAGLCFSAYAVMDPKTEEVHDYSTDPSSGGAFDLHRYPEFMSPSDYRIQLRGGIIWMSSNTVVLKKSAFLEAGGLLPQLRWHCDWFVNTVVALRHGVCVVPEVLSAIRARSESSFSGDAFANVRAQRKVIRNVIYMAYRPRYWDMANAFFRYPVLLTPLANEVGLALAQTPFGWPFLPRYLSYCVNALDVGRNADSPLPARLAREIFARETWAHRQGGRTPGAAVPPTVSVIMANYNHAHYLRESLGALCKQTRPPEELIVVDDGSTDNSLEVLEEFAERYPFVRILRNERNRGQLYSVNRALREARGDYINWAAADDLVASTFLEKTLACASRHPEAGVCQTEYALFYESGGPFVRQGSITRIFDFTRMPEYLDPWRYREWLKDEIVWLSTNGALIRREALLEMGAYHEKMRWHADWFSAQAAALRYGICIVPEPLAALRVQESSYSADGMRNPDEQRRVLDAIFDKVREPAFRDIRRDFHHYSRVLSALGPHIYSYLPQRPGGWSYLISHLWWQLCRAVAHHRSVRFANRVARLSLRRATGRAVMRVLLFCRSLLRLLLSPLAIILRGFSPLYRKLMNWLEDHAPHGAKRVVRWIRHQIAFLLSR